MSKEFICETHRQIEKCAKDMSKIKDDKYNNVQDLLNDVKDVAETIKNLARHAMKSGQRMEKRMRDYRRAIEKLGFTRKERRVNKKWEIKLG